jgi:hypothetical protein
MNKPQRIYGWRCFLTGAAAEIGSVSNYQRHGINGLAGLISILSTIQRIH